MFEKYHHITSKLMAISLIVVVGIHSLNSFFNTHCHQLADGTVITHAHPYERGSGSGPFESHHHSAAELVFLASLMYYLPVFAIVFLGFSTIKWKELKRIYQFHRNHFTYGKIELRGPPVMLFLS